MCWGVGGAFICMAGWLCGRYNGIAQLSQWQLPPPIRQGAEPTGRAAGIDLFYIPFRSYDLGANAKFSFIQVKVSSSNILLSTFYKALGFLS